MTMRYGNFGRKVCIPIMETLANRLEADQKTVAERKWNQRTLAPKPQLPCDHGLFSDEANQLDLVEMLQDPTNGE